MAEMSRESISAHLNHPDWILAGQTSAARITLDESEQEIEIISNFIKDNSLQFTARPNSISFKFIPCLTSNSFRPSQRTFDRLD